MITHEGSPWAMAFGGWGEKRVVSTRGLAHKEETFGYLNKLYAQVSSFLHYCLHMY